MIVADYGHGLITPRMADLMIEKSRFLAVNTQINAANIGFHTISKYRRADYVCIQEGELRHDSRSRAEEAKGCGFHDNRLRRKQINVRDFGNRRKYLSS